ncbi:twin-arginine translocation signal domain-containing protein [Terasakiella sp. A23]|uniref:twin-arginine translocation signal domain-containing protein n=1 Tax=Terasakiella sp. FCG-A23 TaxID=3080561 RepID=UPI002955D903|nr:twin-arginine translocation signal domain-containing protein [Terasakiella sp. A23]MDV7340231.1 twin-arginine translocation signal domain-containing protein [Terasakiella sp. A23]
MDQKEGKTDLGRRNFLKAASVGAAVGTVAVVSGEAKAAASVEEAGTKGGYSKTDHIAKYYELASV